MIHKKNTKEVKRTSTRVRTISSALRVVDDDTRHEFQLKRLTMLEADNFVEEQEISAMNEDAYMESDDEKNGIPKKKRQKNQSSISNLKSKWMNKKVKSLERMTLEQGYSYEHSISSGGDHIIMPNYLSITAEASACPARHYCSMCGCLGKYTCTRCGSRYCSIKCNDNHKETRCMKFSL